MTPDVAKDWSQFLQLISHPDVRNLYIASHMAETVLGPIFSAEFKKRVKHRYHFVFLDGCASVQNALIFGFQSAELEPKDIDFYRGTSLPVPRRLRPAGGVAFSQSFQFYKPYAQPNAYLGYIPEVYAKFYVNFQTQWTVAQDTVQEALQFAVDRAMQATPQPFSGPGPWNVVRVLGYKDLHHNEFNGYHSTW
jgi:hypothetical protein